MKTDELFEKLKKSFPQILVALVLLAGMMLIFGSKSEKTVTPENIEEWNEKLEKFLENMEGVGECEVLIFPAEGVSSANAVKGISIVCQGDSTKVKGAITEAVATLFGINETQISINKKK